jgi:hypothetical protein
MMMLKYFFQIGTNPADKFDKFKIRKEQYKEFVYDHCGKYPVVNLDLKV